MFRAAIFDFDDTLIRSKGDRPERLIHALSEFGCNPNERALQLRLGNSFYDMVMAVCPEIVGRFDEFIDFYVEELKKFPPAAERNVRQILSQIAENRVLVVHSSSHSKLIEADLGSIGALESFSCVFGSDTQPKYKPDPKSLDPVLNYFTKNSIKSSDVIYIGDSVADYLTAKGAGLEFIATVYFRDNAKELHQAGLEESKIFPSVREISRSIDALGRVKI